MKYPTRFRTRIGNLLITLVISLCLCATTAAQNSTTAADLELFKMKAQAVPTSATLPQTPTSLNLRLAAQGFRAVQSESPDRFRTGSVAALGVFVREEKPDMGAVGTPHIGQVGQPDIALRMVDVLLPFDADTKTLRLEYNTPTTVRLGQYDIRPIGRSASYKPESNKAQDDPVPNGVRLDIKGRDLSIYGKDMTWPSQPVIVLSTGNLRQYQHVRLLFSPFRWNPSKRTLDKITDLNLTIRWQKRAVNTEIARFRLSDPMLLDKENAIRFINWGTALNWYLLGLQFRRIGTYDFVIVTTQNIRTDSTMLSDFIAHKEAEGYSVATISVEGIDVYYSGSERADRIRAFLQDKYDDWGIQHVLLIGGPDPYDKYVGAGDTVGNVPMKMAWPRGDGWTSKQDGEACPTDHYFGDLSENWDVDGDGYAASLADDFTTISYTVSCGGTDYTLYYNDYGIDFDMEVRVGRLPFDDTNTIDTVLERIINYEDADLTANPGNATLRQRVYLAMSSFADDTDYSYLGRNVHNDFLDPAGLRGITLYEPTSPFAHDIELRNEALIDTWTDTGAGLVIWAGHGSQTSATILYDDTSLMRQSEAVNLDFNPRSFIFEGSCQNAWPENSSNLALSLIAEGGMTAIAGTRNSWYSHAQEEFGTGETIGDIGYWVTQSHVSGCRAGYAILYMRSKGYGFDSSHWMQNLLTYNLYGDPTVRYIYN